MKGFGGIIALICFIFGVTFLVKESEKRRNMYMQSCKFKVGEIVYLKPDSSKAVISGVAIPFEIYAFKLDTASSKSYEIITLNNVIMTVHENIFYKEIPHEETIY